MRVARVRRHCGRDVWLGRHHEWRLRWLRHVWWGLGLLPGSERRHRVVDLWLGRLRHRRLRWHRVVGRRLRFLPRRLRPLRLLEPVRPYRPLHGPLVRSVARCSSKVRTSMQVLVTGLGVLAVVGLLVPPTALAQWARPGGRPMAPPPGQYGAPSPPYGYPAGGGYPPSGYPPPAGYPLPGGYPPPPSYLPPGGYPPPAGYAPQGGYPPAGGYAPPPGYPPAGSSPPPGAYAAPPAAGAPQAPGPGAPPPPGPGGPAPTPSGPTPYAYPQRGQSPEQVTADRSQCGAWATQQTGYNPSAPAPAAPATATSPEKSGGLFGGVTRREERRERWEHQGSEQGSSSASAPNPQQTDAYNRALDACLSARGYTVR